MDGTVEKTESDDTQGVVLGKSTLGFHSGHVGSMSNVGGTGVFAYRLVHSQESVRLLDLRLDFADGINVVSVGRLLRAIERGIVESAVKTEFELAASGRREALNDQVRYKDS